MHSQIVKIRLCDQLTESIRHTANTKLQCRTIYKVRKDMTCYLPVHLCRMLSVTIIERIMMTFNNIINIRDMYAFIVAAMNLRHMLVNLNNDYVCHSSYRRSNARIYGEIKIPVPVHRRYADHNNIYGQEVLVVSRIVREDHRNIITESSVTKLSLISRAMPAVIYKMLLIRIAFNSLNRAVDQITSDLHIPQFILPLGKRPVQKYRLTESTCIINPLSAPDNVYRLFRRTELFCIFFAEIIYHNASPIMKNLIILCFFGVYFLHCANPFFITQIRSLL